MAIHQKHSRFKLYPISILYFIVLLLDLLFIITGQSHLRWISKPLLVLMLIVSLIMVRKEVARPWFVPWMGALVFSWLGDVLLMFADSFFIPGLVAFLLAHVCYILMFVKFRPTEPLKKKVFLISLLMTLIYFISFYRIILVETGSLFLAVLIYAIIILTMWLVAAHRSLRIHRINYWLLSGAVLFVLSDSILGYNNFVESHPLYDGMVMLSYGIAQYCLFLGILFSI